MGWYEDQVFNRVVLELALDVADVHRERALALAPAAGAILEVGPGTGLNVPNYPAAVTGITAVGPDPALHPFAAQRASARGLGVTYVHGGAEQLPFADASFDTVVCTLTLCTVPDPAAAVREFARVLRRRGLLLFLEHVVAPPSPRRVLQRVFNPVLRPALCGCNMTRDTAALIAANGFALDGLVVHEMPAFFWLHRRIARGMGVPLEPRVGAAPRA